MIISLRTKSFNPWNEIQNAQTSMDFAGAFGATAVFVGTMRDFNEGDQVTEMDLEYYPGMTEKELQRLCIEVTQDSPVLEVLVVHRVGKIYPGDDIVLVCVWSAHRAAAFDSCRSIMETLKHRAPFWKKEKLIDRHRWVEKNTSG